MLRTVILLLSGNAFGSLVLLLRNLVIARLLSLEDFGIAATFAVSIAIVEMASGLGLQQLIVQDKNGEDPRLQAGLQGFNLVRGLFAGLALFLLAPLIAQFLGIPEIAWAYQLMALVPVMRGFEHFDIHRLNRAMQFGPLILTKTVPALISVLSIWPLFMLFDDYRVMLYAVLLQWALAVLVSHLVAKRRFALSFHNATMRKSLKFGWPLLINNILLFLVFQGDRLLVGRELGMAELAIFSMGVTFTLTPTLVSGASEQQFFLPQLSAAREERARFQALAHAAMQASLVSGLVLVLLVAALADPLVQVLLGAKYAALAPLLPWFAIWQALRTFKTGNTVVALSQAQTANAMIANAVRMLALPVAWFALLQGAEILHVIWIAIAGELCGYLVSLVLATRRARLPVAPLALPLVFAALTLVAVGLQTGGLEGQTGIGIAGWALVLSLAMGAGLSMRALIWYAFHR